MARHRLLLRGTLVFATPPGAFRPYRPGYASAQAGTAVRNRRLVKQDNVPYRAAMRPAIRYILAFFLTTALIVGGAPFAHAMPVHTMPVHVLPAHATPPVAPAVQEAHRHDAGHAMHHWVQNEAAPDMQGDGTEPGRTVNDLCKGLKCCSMCATAYVEPSQRHLSVDRISLAVRYDMVVVAHPQAMTFVDPGIPIA